MGKQALRCLLGAGYVALVTLLLLYQMGVIGKTKNTFFAVLGTLLLGIALAVVLVMYMRVTDQLKTQAKTVHHAQDNDAPAGNSLETEDRQTAEAKGDRPGSEQSPGSYEELYAAFLKAAQESQLSERELEVAWLLYRGYTNRQIGEELYIAETTVKKHVSHIYQKMEVCCRKDFRAKIQEAK